MQVKKKQLELDMEQQTGSILGKKYAKALCCHLAYLTYIQSISWEKPGWMKHKLESKSQEEISIISDMQMTPPVWQKVKKNKRASRKVKEEREKVGLKLNIQKTKIVASGPITSWQIVGKQWLTLFFWAPKSLQMVISAMKLKDAYSLEGKLWPT